MILKLNTTICPIVCIGTYQTFLSPDYIYERDCCEYDHAFNKGLISEDELDYLHEASYKYFDFMNYLNTIGQYALNEISEFFDDINHFLKIKLANQSYEVYSPREYNFQTDGMDYFVEIDEREIDNLGTRLKGNNKFLTWIYDSYRTKSGFISFMPYTEEMFFDALAGKDIERALSMYLMWVLHTEFLDEGGYGNPYQESLAEYVSGNISGGDFINDTKYEEIINKLWEVVE